MYLINSEINAKLAIRDRGLAFGDGLFETIAIINNKVHNWSLHYHRLVKGARCLGIKPPKEQQLCVDLNLLLDKNKLERFILKIILSRGQGGKGYLCPKTQVENVIIMANPWPKYPAYYYLQGIDVEQLNFKLSIQPALAGIKHLNRLEQVLARKELASKYQEALLLNSNNKVIEGISANLFFVVDDCLCFPALMETGIAGTVREQVITLCLRYKIKYKIADFNLTDLLKSKEIFYSNSIIGLWPVKKLKLLDGQAFHYQPGEIYKQLAKTINTQLGHPVG